MGGERIREKTPTENIPLPCGYLLVEERLRGVNPYRKIAELESC